MIMALFKFRALKCPTILFRVSLAFWGWGNVKSMNLEALKELHG
jgi:hypothetical protein